MSQAAFEAEHREGWNRLGLALDELDAGKPLQQPDDFPILYRRLCQHLALARHRLYGANLVEELNELAMRGYRHLYGSQVRAHLTPTEAIGVFARALRADWQMLLFSAALFVVPGLLGFLAVRWAPESIY